MDVHKNEFRTAADLIHHSETDPDRTDEPEEVRATLRSDWDPPATCRCGRKLELVAALDPDEGWILTAECDTCEVSAAVDWPFEGNFADFADFHKADFYTLAI